jgi:hypothetical protein
MTIQSDKLPSYLRPLLRFQPARPSTISQGPGSDVGQNPTPGSLQINLLFTMYAEHAPGLKADAKPLFLQKTLTVSLDTNRFGGAERDRTADPLLAKQVLSQLSYSPISSITPISQPGFGNFRVTVFSQPTFASSKWWAREDLNFRPHAYQACALTN